MIVIDDDYKNTEEYLQHWRANKNKSDEEEYNDMMRHDL